MAETLVLDPVAIAAAIGRAEWDITQYVAEAGPDWGDAAIEQYLADTAEGSLPVDYRMPNRTISIPLLLMKSRSGTAYTFDQVRRRFQQKAALFQKEGGWVARTTSVGTVYADVIGASLKLGGSTAQALWGIDADAVLTLTCLPDWYGDEVVGSIQSNAASTAELVYTITGVTGEMPARSRLELTELSSIDLHGLLWGVRSRNYSAATTARLAYQAEALTPIAPAASAANAIAAGGNEVAISAVAKDWTAVLSTDLAGTGALTHVGSYRVWARVRTTATVKAQRLRLVWDVGDLLRPVENAPVRLPLITDYWLADLGSIRLDPAPVGVHSWRGVIQAADGDGVFAVDKLWLQPLDEAAGRLFASPIATVGLTSYSARDEFDQTAGNLTAKALPIGGAWTFAAGDPDDFTVDATNHRVLRSAILDSADNPRLVYASTPSLAAVATQIDFYHPTPVGGGAQGAWLLFRYVNATNYGFAYASKDVTGHYVVIGRVVAGVRTNLAFGTLPPLFNAWWTLRAAVTDRGYAFAWVFPQGATPPPNPAAMRYDPTVFATGQPLASGKVGFGDFNNNNNTGTDTRYYDNFLAWIPDADAVMFANRSAELRYDGMFREAPGGVGYAPISAVVGDLLRLPPAGLEGRTTEIFLKPTFGDLDQGADSSLTRLQARMRYRPSYLFVP